MRYIFYHIFKRLGWTDRRPIMVFKSSEDWSDEDVWRIENKYCAKYEIMFISNLDTVKNHVEILY